MTELEARCPTLGPDRARRLARTYGTRAKFILDKAAARGGLGAEFGAGLSEVEVDYLMAEEWAQTAADIVWRRTKLGLRLTAAEIDALDLWMRRTATASR